MKKLTTALTAIAILGCGAAFAADQGGTAPSSAAAPTAPAATPVKKPSLKSCNKKADAQKLTGKERSQFVTDCKAGKSS
jgi:hypothetical protein